MAGGEVGVAGLDVVATEARGAALDLLRVDADEWRSRMAQPAAAVWRVVQPRLSLTFALVGSRDAGNLARDRALRINAGRLFCSLHQK
jgi:hypothetical protein